MKHTKGKSNSTFVRWVAFLIPIVNLWALWQVAKIWANHEEERGD